MSKYSRCGGVYSYDNSEDNTQGDRGRRNKSQGDRGGSNTYGDRLTAGRNNFVQTGSNPLQYDPFRGFRKKYGVPIRGRSVDLDVRILFSDNQLYLELYHQCLDFSQTYDSSNDNCCYLHFGEIGQRYVGSPNRDEVVKDVIKRRCDKLYEYFAEAVKVQIIFEVFSAGSGAIALLLSENDYKRVANKQFVFTLDRNKFDLHFYTMKDIFRLLQEIAKTQQEQEKNEQQQNNNKYKNNDNNNGNNENKENNESNGDGDVDIDVDVNVNGGVNGNANPNRNDNSNDNNNNNNNNNGGQQHGNRNASRNGSDVNRSNGNGNGNENGMGFSVSMGLRVETGQENKEENKQENEEKNNNNHPNNGQAANEQKERFVPSDNSNADLHKRRGYLDKTLILFDIPKCVQYGPIQIAKIIEGHGYAKNPSLVQAGDLIAYLYFDPNDRDSKYRRAFCEFYNRNVAGWFSNESIKIGENWTYFDWKTDNNDPKSNRAKICETPSTDTRGTPN